MEILIVLVVLLICMLFLAAVLNVWLIAVYVENCVNNN